MMSYIEAGVGRACRVEITQYALEGACGREVREEIGVLPERHAFAWSRHQRKPSWGRTGEAHLEV